MISRGIPVHTIGYIALCLLVSFSHFVLSAAVLAAVVYAFGRLSAEGELTALRACGVSPYRIAAPAVGFGALVTVLALWVGFEAAPWGERTMTRTLYEAGAAKKIPPILANSFNHDFFGLVLFTESVDPHLGRMERVFIQDERDAENPSILVAPVGYIMNIAPPDALERRIVLKLQDGKLLRLNMAPGTYEGMGFHEYTLFLETERPDVGIPDIPRMAPAKSVIEHLKHGAPGSREALDYATEFWKRLWLSLTPIPFILLGIGLGTIPVRSASGSAAISSLGAATVFWTLLTWAAAMSLDGKLPAWFAMGIPDAAIVVAAIPLFRRLF